MRFISLVVALVLGTLLGLPDALYLAGGLFLAAAVWSAAERYSHRGERVTRKVGRG